MNGKAAKRLRKIAAFKKSIKNDESLELSVRNRVFYAGKIAYKLAKRAFKATPHNEKDY